MTSLVLDHGDVQVHHGDCIEVMTAMPAASVDAIVTDPPYGIDFMGKAWDRPGEMVGTALGISGGFQRFPPGVKRPEYAKSDPHVFQAWCFAWATEALRVLKPGGYLLAFGGTRMYHRLACGIEDSGFEIRDLLAWLYGQGMPKSLDVSKAIDKAAGAEREVIGERPDGMGAWNDYRHGEGEYPLPATVDVTSPATPEAQQWEGFGTNLKPAIEPVAFARKPLIGTVVANVLEHGTGALNIDGTRIKTGDDLTGGATGRRTALLSMSGQNARPNHDRAGEGRAIHMPPGPRGGDDRGRWPSNVIVDTVAAADIDEQSGILTSGANPTRRGADGDRNAFGEFAGQHQCHAPRGTESGGASRFFDVIKWTDEDFAAMARALYVAKPSTDERGGSKHPTVKPIKLMRILVRMVTPPGGVVLDPFAGSGTTLLAARREGFRAIGIEREAEYLPDITTRLTAEPPTLFGGL